MPGRAEQLPAWTIPAELQEGIVSRGQLLAAGLTPAQARTNIDNGRWRPLLPGVYATFTGPVSPLARTWSAVLYAGQGAIASHRTALWLASVLDEPTDPVHVSIPASRRVLPQPNVRIHLSRALDDPHQRIVHPSSIPPRSRLEVALLDQCERETANQVTHLVLSAIQRRLTTADRIHAAMEARSRLRWRGLLAEMLSQAREGVTSPLELRYRRDVELRHRLPGGIRNRGESAPSGGRIYRDVRYRHWQLIVELDGMEAHPLDRAFRDLRRDNRAVVGGDTTLRYGWRDVVGDPCGVAAQVALVLAGRGWPGHPRPCGPTCDVATHPDPEIGTA